MLGGGFEAIDCRVDGREANDVAETEGSKQLQLVYEQAVNVSKRDGIEVQTASDVGETK